MTAPIKMDDAAANYRLFATIYFSRTHLCCQYAGRAAHHHHITAHWYGCPHSQRVTPAHGAAVAWRPSLPPGAATRARAPPAAGPPTPTVHARNGHNTNGCADMNRRKAHVDEPHGDNDDGAYCWCALGV